MSPTVFQVDYGNIAVSLATLGAIWFAFWQNRETLRQERSLWEDRVKFDQNDAEKRRQWDIDQDLTREVASLITDAKLDGRREDVIRRIDYLHLRLDPNVKIESDLRDAIQEFAGALEESGTAKWIATSRITNALRALVSTRSYTKQGIQHVCENSPRPWWSKEAPPLPDRHR